VAKTGAICRTHTCAGPEPVEIAPKPIKAVEPLAMKLPLHQAEVLASKVKEPAPAQSLHRW
jgi:hypothetical protein